ncbi:MAG: DUF2273 domain-containing protein [Dethiobacteria bacterium]
MHESFIIFILENWGKILGGLLGLFVALVFILFGFWKGLFVILCLLVGVYLGNKVEKSEDLQNFFYRLWHRQDRF